MKKFIIPAAVFVLGFVLTVAGQIPVELTAGSTRATFDMMFFKSIPTAPEYESPWLFFQRNRVSYDYRMTETNYLPSFSNTTAFSYNNKKLFGFAPVAVLQILNRGAFSKTGLQYVAVWKDLTIFGWSVVQLQKQADVDVFLLTRYTPEVSENINIYLQNEVFTVLSALSGNKSTVTIRTRIGLQNGAASYGVATDIATGGKLIPTTENYGIFFRYQM